MRGLGCPRPRCFGAVLLECSVYMTSLQVLLHAAAYPSFTGWGPRLCILASPQPCPPHYPQDLSEFPVEFVSGLRPSDRAPAVCFLHIPIPRPEMRFLHSQPQARIPCQAHLNHYYLFSILNLAQVTISEHFPKLESYYSHCFAFISSSGITID